MEASRRKKRSKIQVRQMDEIFVLCFVFFLILSHSNTHQGLFFRSVESEGGEKEEEAGQGSAEDGEERETSQAADRMRGSHSTSQRES